MSTRSVLEDTRQVQRAVELIRLGARLQMLQAETALPYERLLRLYKEVAGRSPSKGQLPFSTDWFTSWQPNIHASLFLSLHDFMLGNTGLRGIDALIKAYRLYLDHIELHGMERVLTLTRAWTLLRFFDAGMLKMAECRECGGRFVAHALDLTQDYVCGLCHVPARAGKMRRREAATASA